MSRSLAKTIIQAPDEREDVFLLDGSVHLRLYLKQVRSAPRRRHVVVLTTAYPECEVVQEAIPFPSSLLVDRIQPLTLLSSLAERYGELVRIDGSVTGKLIMDHAAKSKVLKSRC